MKLFSPREKVAWRRNFSSVNHDLDTTLRDQKKKFRSRALYLSLRKGHRNWYCTNMKIPWTFFFVVVPIMQRATPLVCKTHEVGRRNRRSTLSFLTSSRAAKFGEIYNVDERAKKKSQRWWLSSREAWRLPTCRVFAKPLPPKVVNVKVEQLEVGVFFYQ